MPAARASTIAVRSGKDKAGPTYTDSIRTAGVDWGVDAKFRNLDAIFLRQPDGNRNTEFALSFECAVFGEEPRFHANPQPFAMKIDIAYRSPERFFLSVERAGDMKKLFTERHGEGKARVAESLDDATREGLLTLVSARIDEEWFGLSFNEKCGDGAPTTTRFPVM